MGPHRAARRGDRPPAGAGDERHRQLPRRADRARVGTGEPRRAARGAAAVHAPARARHRRRTTSRRAQRARDLPRGGARHRPRRPAASSCAVRRTGWRRRAASPTRSPSGATRSWRAVARSRAERWPSRRSASRCPTPTLDDLHAAIARTRWPDEVEDAGWDYGTPARVPAGAGGVLGRRLRLARARAGAQLAAAVPHRQSTRPGSSSFGLHFVHQPGVGPAPLPLVLSHGWPSTHYEYHDVVARLANPGAFGDDPADAFHVVVPSLPGLRLLRHPAPTRHDAARDVDDVRRADARARVRPLRRRRVRLGCVRDRAARPRPPRRARRHPHGDAQLPRRRTTSPPPKTPRSARGPRRGGARSRATAPSRAPSRSRSRTG